MTEDTKATRETKVKGERMESTDARVNLVSLDLLAVKALLDKTARRESMDQRETLALMELKEKKEIPGGTANQDDLETMDHWAQRVIQALVVLTGTKESAAKMDYQGMMDLRARKGYLERRGSKVPVETEAQEENRGIQDPVENKGGRAQLAPTAPPVKLASPGLPGTEEMKAKPDQKDPEGREESKELQETEALWERGEQMVLQEMAQKVVMVSRVILGPVETRVSRVAGGRLDPKEMMASPEIQAPIITNRGF